MQGQTNIKSVFALSILFSTEQVTLKGDKDGLQREVFTLQEICAMLCFKIFVLTTYNNTHYSFTSLWIRTVMRNTL